MSAAFGASRASAPAPSIFILNTRTGVGRRCTGGSSPRRRWLEGRPINVYVIEHADGVVVFDTGRTAASVTDPSYFPDGANGVIYRRLARFHVDEDETLTAGLLRLGYRTSDVTCAVVSHLHQDHIGGVGEIPDAELLVADDEWRSLHRPMAETRGLFRVHIELPDAKWRPISYEPVDDPALRPFTSVTTCSGTAHSRSSPRLDTRRVQCRCSCAERRTSAAARRRPHLRRTRLGTRRLWAASAASARCRTHARR